MALNKSLDPGDFIKQLSDLNSGAQRSMQSLQFGGQPAAPAAGGNPNYDQVKQMMLNHLQYQSDVGEIVRQQVLAMDLQSRDNAALAEKVEALESELTKAKEAVAEGGKVFSAKDKEMVDALNAATTERATEKKELEGKVTAKDEELKALTEEVTKLKGELEMLKTDLDAQKGIVETLTKEKEDLEARVKKLGAGKLGLGAPEAGKTTTEQGDPVAPTTTMTAKALAAAARSANPDLSEEQANQYAVLGELLTTYINLKQAVGKDASKSRELAKFMNEPAAGCADCEKDPGHHRGLITQAVRNRDQIQAFFATA